MIAISPPLRPKTRMMTCASALLLALLLLLAACQSGAPAMVPHAENSATSSAPSTTDFETPTSLSSPQSPHPPVLEGQPAQYQVVFQQGDFEIWEAFLGQWDAWEFAERSQRTSNTTSLDLKTDNNLSCYESIEKTGWCTLIADVNGQQFQLIHNSLAIGGSYKLKKNERLIWEDYLAGGTCTPVHSMRQIGDEIAIDYLDVDPVTYRAVKSILLTQGDSVIDIVDTTAYDAVFAPSEIHGQLAYFAAAGSSGVFLVFDGGKVGEEYKTILDPCCCWDGPPMGVYNDGEVVDFFAEKEDGWYHVQAGNLTSLK